MGATILTLGVAVGCSGGDADEGVAQFQSALTEMNGLAANGLAANGLAANGLAANGLAANGLAANGLAANGLAANGLAANGLAANGLAANGLAANGLAANGLAANGLAANGFAANGLAANGLAANGLAANGLAANGLAANGLAANGMPVSVGVAAGLQDEASRLLFGYIVSCALPEGVTLAFSDGAVTHIFRGQIGLAPQWLTSGCDLSCQRWVSACLIARTNFRGEHVEISIRGANKALTVEPHEQQSFTVREAAYYGNVFQAQPALYACLPSGATTIDRVCGPSPESCVVTRTGHCEAVCAGVGRNQSYRSCRSAAAPAAEEFAETITVFRRP